MGRRDELDPGLWTEGGALAGTFRDGRSLRASQLVIPLDTHTGRISQYLALTERKTLGWRAALEVTASCANAIRGTLSATISRSRAWVFWTCASASIGSISVSNASC